PREPPRKRAVYTGPPRAIAASASGTTHRVTQLGKARAFSYRGARGRAGDRQPPGEVPYRPGGAPSGLSVPRRDLRCRPHLQQHRRVVALDPGRGPAPQGPALLPPAGRERADDLRGLRLGAEPAARRQRHPGATPAGEAALRPPARRLLRAEV